MCTYIYIYILHVIKCSRSESSLIVMNFYETFVLVSFFIFLIFEAVETVSTNESSTKMKKKEFNRKELERSKRGKESSTFVEPVQQFVSEEYNKSYKAERVGPYQVVYMNRNQGTNSNSECFPPHKIKASKTNKKKYSSTNSKKSAYFNNEVESVSDNSSIADESPRVRPFMTARNAEFSDFTSGKRSTIVHHLCNKHTDFIYEDIEDKSDVLGEVVRKCDFYTTHNDNFDGFSTMSKKVEDESLWRNESIHPHKTFDRSNEVHPYDSKYIDDVDTSQKEMETHFGRQTGRDNKSKMFQNRNSFSSVNDGCFIS